MESFYVVIGVIFLLLSISLLSPFPLWNNVLNLVRYTLINDDFPFTLKVRLLLHIVFSVMMLWVKSIFWHIDKLFLVETKRPDLVVIVGSPRSGTTFLHRVLAQNSKFHSLAYFQMKFPSVSIWKMCDFLGLTNYIKNINYWPKNSAGKLASKLHKHTFGDKEEIGMFLEEIMFSHYFLYRRFPSPQVASDVANLNNLSQKQWRKLLRGVEGVINRSQYYHSEQSKIVLMKENESATLLRRLSDIYPNIKYVFIYRSTDETSASYQKLSIVSTEAKTGIDPRSITGWQDWNNKFRLNEMSELLDLYKELPEDSKFLISYNSLVDNLENEIVALLSWLSIEIDHSYQDFLQREMKAQSQRDKGYENENFSIGNTEEYNRFFEDILSTNNK